MKKIIVITNKSLDDVYPGIKNLLQKEFGEQSDFVEMKISNDPSTSELLRAFTDIQAQNPDGIAMLVPNLALMKLLSCYACNSDFKVLWKGKDGVTLF